MHQQLKKLLWMFLRSPISKRFKRLVLHLADQVKKEHETSLRKLRDEVCGRLTVLTGPFRGLRYPEVFAHGSAFYPKIIGSYELELHPTFERLLKNDYRQIIDIGSAEGYYLIGLARLAPKASVYGYEIDSSARAFSLKMAESNGVADRVTVQEKCTETTLAEFAYDHCLILCDCEGYENELFTKVSASRLKDCDLIIESHDFIRPKTRDRLIELFSQSHKVSIIKSQIRTVWPFRKILKGLNSEVKRSALAEYRPVQMEWLVFERK